MVELLLKDLTHLGLITAFALIALIMWLSTKLSKYLTEPYRVCRRVNILRDYPDDKTKLYPR
ncbi:hypothetical protein V6359_17690, partial [Acinetobacter baumannii]